MLPRDRVDRHGSRRLFWLFVAILIVGLGARLHVAAGSAYVWDEARDWIPLATTIDLRAGHISLPVRGEYHPALPAYGIAAGRALLGEHQLGSRVVGIAAGIFTVLLVAATAGRMGGRRAGLLAAIPVAVSEYHVQVSALATEKVYYLFFAALLMWFLVRFIEDASSAALFGAAVAGALALMSKELALLLVPACALGLAAGRPGALREPRTWLAVALVLLLLTPDIVWHFSSHVARADYATHLARLDGIGLSPQPIAFYLHAVVGWVAEQFGGTLHNTGEEYAPMNPLLGAVLLAGVVGAVWGRARGMAGPSATFALACFLVPFLFLTLVSTRQVGELDRQLFFWADVTLLPAGVLTGVWLAHGGRGVRFALAMLVAGSAWSLWNVGARTLAMATSNMEWSPEVLQPADGTLRRIEARILPCFVCGGIVRAEFLEAQAWEDDVRVSPEGSAMDVVPLTNESASIQVRAVISSEGRSREYVLAYRLTDDHGRESVVHSTVVVTAANGVEYRPRAVW